MVRDIPFDAARDPGAEHADKRGLDDVLAVDEIIAVRLVHGLENPAADLGQDDDPDIGILENQGPVGPVFLAV